MAKISRTYRIDENLEQRFVEACLQAGIDKTEVVTSAIEKFIKSIEMKGTVTIERRKRGSHVLGGGEFIREYEIEYHHKLIDDEFYEIESDFNNGQRIFDDNDWQLEELEKMKRLEKGTYFFDCGDYIYVVEVL